jgi:hypothetical protein
MLKCEKGKMRRFLSNRTCVAFVLSGFIAVLILCLRNSVKEEIGVLSNMFWAQKRNWHNCADIVIAGDSRIYRGISPNTMQQVLPGYRINNFGFSSIGLSSTYLTAVENVLDSESRQPVIVLGVSPNSLTEGAVRENDFLWREADTFNASPNFLVLFAHWFRPIKDREAFNICVTIIGCGSKAQLYYQEYFQNGWVASKRIPEFPRRALSIYATVFDEGRNGPVSQRVIEELLQEVERISKQGKQVFGFRPPTSSELVLLEDTKGDFNEREFVDNFEKVGGIWLEVDQNAYHSYDGNHLERNAAETLSLSLAKMIQSRLAKVH